MTKIETTLAAVIGEISAFYDPAKWRLITVNALEAGEGFEVQWIFARVGCRAPLKILAAHVAFDETVPSCAAIIPSASFAEAELFDLLGVRFEGAKGGMFLEPDDAKTPLKKNRA
ncbi:hypothetical protein FACS1894103_4360 [Campylobacterota bacterium]|nr:hypothetical protein FACS1894103_4360 [Campylobacterota bacterium]